MNPEIVAAFVEEAESLIGGIRSGILVCIQDSDCQPDLTSICRGTGALCESAEVAQMTEFAAAARELDEHLRTFDAQDLQFTPVNAGGVLDMLVHLESLLSDARILLDSSDFDLGDFVDSSFDNLTREPAATELGNRSSEDAWDDDEFEIDDELLEVFALEAEELLHNIESSLEKLAERPDDRDSLWEIRRNAHTFKGAAGIVGFKDPSRIAHRIEDLLDRLKENSIGSNESIFALLRSATSCLRGMTCEKRYQELTGSVAGLFSEFDKICASFGAVPGEPAPQQPASEPTETVSVPVPLAPKQAQANSQRARSDSRNIIRVSLSELDEISSSVRDMLGGRATFEQRLADFEREVAELQQTVRRLRSITSRLEIDFEASMLGSGRSMLGAAWPKLHGMLPGFEPDGFDSLELDRYTDFHQSTRELAESVNDLSSIGTALDNLRSDLDTLAEQNRRNVEGVQERLTGMRMVEFGTLLTRLERAARVAADEAGKKVDVVIENCETPIDTQILDVIIEPITHLLRNSVVHGIELPDKRRLLNKPESGTIKVGLINEETHLVITLSDDGGGIEVGPLKKKAIEAGLVTADQARKMVDEEALGLIFHKGLTTAAKLTLSAGRGVGMSIVKESIEAINGTITIDSVPQQGVTFTIRIPLAMVVIGVLTVRAAGSKLAIPMKLVRQVCDVTAESVTQKGNSHYVLVGGSKHAMHELEHLIGQQTHPETDPQTRSSLIIESGGKSLALMVEDVLNTEEVIVKPLGRPLDGIKGLLGAAILGCGELVPILDLPALVRMSGTQARSKSAQPEDKQVTVLIVDDSPSVRLMTSRAVENAGWNALTAKDGLDALDLLRSALHQPDVILTDIEMPRMDGYGLMSTLGQSEQHKQIPVVVITSRAGEKHREKASEYGVSEYLVKPFEEHELHSVITRLAKVGVPV
jgi:chemosensory pili system protein ChpA (sensor histidine kinase/response regulator)